MEMIVNCVILKTKCNEECKHVKYCKLHIVRGKEGEEVLRVKRMSKNAKLPVRSTEGAAGYDLSAAQAAVVPAHGKCLVQTGLKVALPSGCYGRIAPRSGLALKKSIDVGAGVIDADYRGELGVLLFNFSDSDFAVNLGDRIAQFILEKIKTPLVKELDSLDETDRGGKGFGSTGLSAAVTKDEDKIMKPEDRMKVANPLAQSRQLITARQIQKLAKADQPIYLVIVRQTHEAPSKAKKK